MISHFEELKKHNQCNHLNNWSWSYSFTCGWFHHRRGITGSWVWNFWICPPGTIYSDLFIKTHLSSELLDVRIQSTRTYIYIKYIAGSIRVNKNLWLLLKWLCQIKLLSPETWKLHSKNHLPIYEFWLLPLSHFWKWTRWFLTFKGANEGSHVLLNNPDKTPLLADLGN